MKAYYDSAFDFPEARKILLGHYKVASEKVLGLEEHPECVSAAGALLSYLYETQLRELPHIEKSNMFPKTNTCLSISILEKILNWSQAAENRKKGKPVMAP